MEIFCLYILFFLTTSSLTFDRGIVTDTGNLDSEENRNNLSYVKDLQRWASDIANEDEDVDEDKDKDKDKDKDEDEDKNCLKTLSNRLYEVWKDKPCENHEHFRCIPSRQQGEFVIHAQCERTCDLNITEHGCLFDELVLKNGSSNLIPGSGTCVVDMFKSDEINGCRVDEDCREAVTTSCKVLAEKYVKESNKVETPCPNKWNTEWCNVEAKRSFGCKESGSNSSSSTCWRSCEAKEVGCPGQDLWCFVKELGDCGKDGKNCKIASEMDCDSV